MEKAKIILIGGAPTTGKSTLAEQLSKRLSIPWISTDQIRTVIKSAIDKSMQTDINELVWKGVVAFVERYHPWNGCIIEGEVILPNLVARDLGHNEEIKIIFLTHSNTQQIERIVSERSKFPYIKTKTLEEQKAKIKDLEELNQQIESDAKAHKFTFVEAQTDKTLDNTLKVLDL
jgi:2-phosphoglycerate kinase